MAAASEAARMSEAARIGDIETAVEVANTKASSYG
jgi:hypothetical protein